MLTIYNEPRVLSAMMLNFLNPQISEDNKLILSLLYFLKMSEQTMKLQYREIINHTKGRSFKTSYKLYIIVRFSQPASPLPSYIPYNDIMFAYKLVPEKLARIAPF
jgi:hypothetical protein